MTFNKVKTFLFLAIQFLVRTNARGHSWSSESHQLHSVGWPASMISYCFLRPLKLLTLRCWICHWLVPLFCTYFDYLDFETTESRFIKTLLKVSRSTWVSFREDSDVFLEKLKWESATSRNESLAHPMICPLPAFLLHHHHPEQTRIFTLDLKIVTDAKFSNTRMSFIFFLHSPMISGESLLLQQKNSHSSKDQCFTFDSD